MPKYIRVESGKAVALKDKLTPAEQQDPSWQGPWDYGYKTSLEHVQGLAADLTALTGTRYVGTDAGDHVSPRFGFVAVPVVGDEVSRSFNGDSYPCGKVVRVSDSLRRVVTRDDAGREFVFNRRKETGSWVQTGGTWSLIPGHVSKWNPEF